MVVTATSITDNAIGTKLLDIVAAHTPTATVAAREYESRPESSVSRTLWASMVNLVRRLTGGPAPRPGDTESGLRIHLDTILGLIAERESTATATVDRLRE